MPSASDIVREILDEHDMSKPYCQHPDCDEEDVFVCTCCHDFYCADHMEGYLCAECDGDLWGDER